MGDLRITQKHLNRMPDLTEMEDQKFVAHWNDFHWNEIRTPGTPILLPHEPVSSSPGYFYATIITPDRSRNMVIPPAMRQMVMDILDRDRGRVMTSAASAASSSSSSLTTSSSLLLSSTSPSSLSYPSLSSLSPSPLLSPSSSSSSSSSTET